MARLENISEIQERIIDRLSVALKVSKSDLDLDAPFSKYALDSLDAVTLVMDLEDQLGAELPPTLLWDYPTVNKCTSYLVAMCQGSASP